MDTLVKSKYERHHGVEFGCKATTLSSVHIGSGNTLSPLADFFIKDDRLFYINTQKFGLLLFEKNKTDEFKKQVNAAADESKHNFLTNYFSTRLQANIEEYVIEGNAVPVFIKGNPVELAECTKTNGKAFIPGSSLKGVLRTAIFFNWLNNNENKQAKYALRDFWKEFEKLYPRRGDYAARQIIAAFESIVEGNCFTGEKDPMSCIMVRDSPSVDNSAIEIREMVRTSLRTETKNSRQQIPALKECIMPGSTFEFSVQVNPVKIERSGTKLYPSLIRSLTNPVNLCKILNEFALTVIDYETLVISEEMADRPSLKKYTSFVDQLREDIQNAGGQTAFIRLGAGKMQFYQTMAMIFFKQFGNNEYDLRWRKYLDFCGGLKEKDPENPEPPFPYPVTRVLTTRGQMPPGWVKIEIA